eukprot:gene10809-biopygen7726
MHSLVVPHDVSGIVTRGTRRRRTGSGGRAAPSSTSSAAPPEPPPRATENEAGQFQNASDAATVVLSPFTFGIAVVTGTQ